MSRPDPKIERRLAAHPFLKGMSPHHIELLALSAMPTEFEVDQVIFQAGEPANGFYLIESGTVVLEGSLTDGEPLAIIRRGWRSSSKNTSVIDVVSAGEPLGWSWLFPPYLWQFNARATEPCTALCLSGIMLRQHRGDDLTLSHELFKRMSEVMVRRLQAARRKLLAEKKPRESAR
jgi:CRP/FNR family cyclic AMP-dependent transcriptional regulator